MSIRLAVACALAVFLLSVALIIGIGINQPVHTTVVSAAQEAPSGDVSQMKRDFLQAPTLDRPSESLPPQPAEAQQNGSAVNQTSSPPPPPPPAPVVAQPPPPPPDYYYTTRAS